MVYFLMALGALFLVLSLFIASVKKSKKNLNQYGLLKLEWKKFLLQKVSFYKKLSDKRKVRFEKDIQHFLATTKISGAETTVDIYDKLLVAAGAVIPVFEFPEWTYHNLNEVILYPGLFNANFATQGKNRFISGMVGTGVLEGKMILSKKSLHLGFDNKTDKKNVAIHEFIHLIDKADGQIDGIPELLVNKEFTYAWLELIRQKIIEIEKNRSDINPYGATSIEEFFPVVAEYFFERPKLLKKKHPKLYAELNEVFNEQPKA